MQTKTKKITAIMLTIAVLVMTLLAVMPLTVSAAGAEDYFGNWRDDDAYGGWLYAEISENLVYIEAENPSWSGTITFGNLVWETISIDEYNAKGTITAVTGDLTAEGTVSDLCEITIYPNGDKIEIYADYTFDTESGTYGYGIYGENYQKVAYALTVTSGTGGGNYTGGTVVNITANAAPEGQVFDKWTTSNGGTFANANSATTTFTMPENAVTITATYKAADHSHSFGTAWEKDATGHWYKCSSCEEKGSFAAHTFGAWVTDKAATATEDGTRHRDCSVCGFTENGTIPATGGEGSPNTGDNSNVMLWLMLGGVSLLGLGITVKQRKAIQRYSNINFGST